MGGEGSTQESTPPAFAGDVNLVVASRDSGYFARTTLAVANEPPPEPNRTR